MLSLGLGCVALSALGSVSASVVMAILLIMGFFGNMAFAVGPPILSDWFPLEVAGTASGLLNSAAGVGGSVGPFVFGRAVDLTGGFAFGWLIAGLTAFLIALVSRPALKSESNPAR
jgi:MFS family permease